MNKKTLLVKCPHCKSEFNYWDSETRPFCCIRCKQIDLGNWLNESYVVPVKDVAVELDEEGDPSKEEDKINTDEYDN